MGNAQELESRKTTQIVGVRVVDATNQDGGNWKVVIERANGTVEVEGWLTEKLAWLRAAGWMLIAARSSEKTVEQM